MTQTPTAEVEQLRQRVQQLEAQLEQAERAEHAPPTAQPRGHRHAWAWVSGVLIVVACLLAPLSVVSVWASTQISNTDQYVRTIEPLADDPGVQSAIAAEVTTAVLDHIQIDQVTTDLLDSLAAQPNVPPRLAAALPGLAGPITNGVEGFTQDQVQNFVASDQFATLWAEVNRAAHEQLVRLLEGDQNGAVTAQGDTVTLNLGPIIEQVKQQLIDRGFTLAEKIPTVDRSFVLVQSDTVTKAQTGYRLLNAMGAWLPVVALGLFALGVAVAGDRRRALLRGSLGFVGTMILLGLGLAILRATYVQSTPAGVLTPDTAGNVFDTLVRFLRTGIRSVAVFGLLLALVAFLSGPSTSAQRTRGALSGGLGKLRGDAEAAGMNTGRFGAWLYAHKPALRLTVLVAAGLVLLFWTRPDAWVVVGTAIVAALVVAVIEFLAAPLPAAMDSSRERVARDA
jgi:hypothetical protein